MISLEFDASELRKGEWPGQLGAERQGAREQSEVWQVPSIPMDGGGVKAAELPSMCLRVGLPGRLGCVQMMNHCKAS